MTFNNDKPIFLQILDRLCDEILAGTYKTDERVPPIREYSALLGVNMNTTFRTYEELARTQIIYTRRGLGYFVADGAREKILHSRHEVFLNDTLPEISRQMKLLGITIDEVVKELEKHKNISPTNP